MSSLSFSSRDWSSSRFICRLRRFLRFSLSATFVAIGVTCSIRAIGADFEFLIAQKIATNMDDALLHLRKAKVLWPYDHNIRASQAYFYTAFRFYDRRKEAMAAIEEELRVNPFAADLWVALMAYRLADGDEPGAMQAVEKIKKLRKGVELVKEPVNAPVAP